MDVEQFMRIHALKAMTGAVAPTLVDLTPAAVARALAFGARGLPHTRDVRMHRVAGHDDTPVFDVTYIGRTQSITLRETVRSIDGQWKIAHIERKRR